MSKKQEILEKLNLDDKDMANIEDDKPSDKGNIDKNAYLINHIRDITNTAFMRMSVKKCMTRS